MSKLCTHNRFSFSVRMSAPALPFPHEAGFDAPDWADKKLPGPSRHGDIGASRLRHSSRPGPEFVGATVGIAGEHLTGAEMAAALSDADLGPECRLSGGAV